LRQACKPMSFAISPQKTKYNYLKQSTKCKLKYYHPTDSSAQLKKLNYIFAHLI
jgi:hypothetical protein